MGLLQHHDQIGNRALGERLTALAPRPAERVLTSARLAAFADPAGRERSPDPLDPATVPRSTLDWTALARPRQGVAWRWTRRLLALRVRHVVPRLGAGVSAAAVTRFGATGLAVAWAYGDGATLGLLANLGDEPPVPPARARPGGRRLHAWRAPRPTDATLPALSASWFLEV